MAQKSGLALKNGLAMQKQKLMGCWHGRTNLFWHHRVKAR
jgi:hypothetical protein